MVIACEVAARAKFACSRSSSRVTQRLKKAELMMLTLYVKDQWKGYELELGEPGSDVGAGVTIASG